MNDVKYTYNYGSEAWTKGYDAGIKRGWFEGFLASIGAAIVILLTLWLRTIL